MKKKWISYILLYCAVGAVLIGLCIWGSEAVTVMAESAPLDRAYIFVIDAGHGGEDGGALSCTGKKESQINLSIALQLDELMHLLGYKTVLTRSEDIALHTSGSTVAERKLSDLKARVQTVQQTENAILISIHQNTYPEGKYSGAQMFYNANPIAETLAQQLQERFVSALNPGSNRKSQRIRNIYLLEQIEVPGILVECGFLSNPQEEAKLLSRSYQLQICCVIASELSQFASDKSNT